MAVLAMNDSRCGFAELAQRIADDSDPVIPQMLRDTLRIMVKTIEALRHNIAALEQRIAAMPASIR